MCLCACGSGQEYDGSDSGARPDEAVSWGKIKLDASPVKVSPPPPTKHAIPLAIDLLHSLLKKCAVLSALKRKIMRP